MFIKRYLSLLLSLSYLTAGWSEVPQQSPKQCPLPSHPLSIGELLNIALENNPQTRTVWWRAQQAVAAQGVAAAAYYPDLNFEGFATNSRDYKFPEGHEIEFTTFGADLSLSYMLYDFGERRANNQAAKAALIAANWLSDWTIQKVMFDVLNHTYSYLNALELLNSRMDSLHDAEDSLDSVQELNRIGLRSITDVYTMKAAFSDMQIGIAQQKAEADIALAKLYTSLGFSSSGGFLQIAGLSEPKHLDKIKVDLDALLSMAHNQRADLLAKQAEISQKKALLAKTIAQYKPKLSLGAETGYQRYIHDRSNGFTYNVGLGLSYPLYDGGLSKSQKSFAQADLNESLFSLEQMQLEVAQEIVSYKRWFEAAQEILQLSLENLDNSIKSFEGTLDRYKAGTQSIFDLTAAQKQLAEARIKHGEAKTHWYKSLAQLAFATGTIASYKESSCAK